MRSVLVYHVPMQNFREYNAKLQSTSGMRRVTSTMKMVSSSHLRRAQRDLKRPAEYSAGLAPVLALVRARWSLRSHPFLAEPKDPHPKPLLFVFSADRGLCGAFSSSVAHAAAVWAASQRADRGADPRAVYVGQKAQQLLKDVLPPVFNLVASDAHPSLRHTHVLASYAVRQFENGTFSEVWVMFNRFVSTLRYEPVALRLFPISDEAVTLLTDGASTALNMPEKPIIEPSYAPLLDIAARQWLDLALFVAQAHSCASEHSARMVAMDNATKNLDRLAKQLLLLRNRARQAAITKELTEIVGGAESLKDS